MIDDVFSVALADLKLTPSTIEKSEDDIYIAGINTPEWKSRMEFYGDTPVDAEDLRDLVLALLQAYQEEIKRRTI